MNFAQEVRTDFLIIGSGIAGLRAALTLAEYGSVLIVTKDQYMESSSGRAQGGIAVAVGEDDCTEDHLEDTLAAGSGLCHREAVQILVEEGPGRVQELIQWGASFDRLQGKFLLGQEGAHRRRRILHAKDATGEEIVQTLWQRVELVRRITHKTALFAVDLLSDGPRCVGALVLDERSKEYVPILSRITLLTCGGGGQVYARTTNPQGSTGDGMAMAYRAGATLEDMEFVQFHPTALHLPGAPPFLITEALRGEGGLLRNIHGELFMKTIHPMGDLAPRDVISRAMVSEMLRTGAPHVWLDASHLSPEVIESRFPLMYHTCRRFGIDMTQQRIPVSPSAHFFIGGVKTDLEGRTNLPGLYAAGETACTGVHGANRLASNSLLEGLVFGARVGESAAANLGRFQNPKLPLLPNWHHTGSLPTEGLPERTALQEAMWLQAGIIRSAASLADVRSALQENWNRHTDPAPYLTRPEWEFRNMITVANLVVQAALMREESVGTHYREDFPVPAKKPVHYPLSKR